MNMTGKPVVFFDWDGTLADSMSLCMGECALTLEWMGLPPLHERDLMRCNGPTLEGAAAILGVPDSRMDEYLQKRKDAQVVIFEKHQKLFNGVYDMLVELRKEADLVIVSNGYPEYLERSLDITKTREIFAHVQPCIEGMNKTQVLTLLLEKIKPRKCVMVGDRTGDIIAGRENGVPTIAAAFGYGTPEEWALADMQAFSVVHLTEMLKEFIRN